jgi:ribosomal protein S18 acetylase RimI-like enzyme
MPDLSMAIRLCQPDDAPRIVPLLQAQVAASGREAPDPDALEELVHALLISQFSDFLLAEVGERALGVLQLNYRLSTWDVAPYAAIEDFYLAPDLRGQGVGTRMLDYACARAEARGARFAQALTRADDRAARRLYEEFGFHAIPQSAWRRDLNVGCEPSDEAASET